MGALASKAPGRSPETAFFCRRMPAGPLSGPPPKPSEAGSVGRGGARERSAVFAALGRKRSKADFATTRFRLRASTFRRRVPATSLGFGFSPPGRVPFGTARKEPKARSLCRGCRQALQIAGSRTGGRGTFSCARESTQRVRIGGEPPMHPPLSCTASLSFRRPEPAAALLPPTACGLLHPYALAIVPHRGAWNDIALGRLCR